MASLAHAAPKGRERGAESLEAPRRVAGRARAICGHNQVRLPRSTERRQTIAYVTLLRSVLPDASGGFRFDGRAFKPGATLDRAELSERAVLLECAGASGPGSGHNRREYLYVLWRYDRATDDWIDIAQARSAGREWMCALGPAAMRALDPHALELAVTDCVAIADRVLSLLEAEVSDAPPGTRDKVAEILCGRLCLSAS